MSSSARPGRVLRSAGPLDEVYILGERRDDAPLPAPLATAHDLVAAAETRAARLIAEAETEAARIVAEARASAQAVRDAARAEGFEAGRAEALASFAEIIEFARRAVADGKAIRDSVAEGAAAVVARAVALATRRIVGEYYEADPGRTALVCAEALRAAAGQEVIRIRVNPGVAATVQAQLVDAAHYVEPDEGVEVGGCIIDLRHGTLDATLDARLSLLELALREAGGEVGP